MDLALQGAAVQAAAIAAKEISAVELFDAVVDRYRRFNPVLNAVIVERIDSARVRAGAADAATAAGESWGPLHGVPMTIKEAWLWEGTPSTSGHESMRDHVADRNDEAVQRLLDAGAVIYGKTNLPVGMADWQTFNPIYGTTGNPWNPDLIPGGSSGGSAVAVATGMAGLELGSDIGASIRNPAHYCGVFGHKPTFGLVPIDGHGAPGDPRTLDIGVGGPIARTSADLTLGLDVVAGAGGLQARGWRLDLPAPRVDRPDRIRAAVMLESPCVEQDAELTAQLTATVEALGTLGVELDREAGPAIDQRRSHEVYTALLRAATGTGSSADEIDEWRSHGDRFRAGDDDYLAVMGHGITLSHWEWAAYDRERQHMQAAWDDFFDDYDLLLCPTAASVAYPHDHEGIRAERTITVNGHETPTVDQLFWAGFSCGVHLPGTVAPAGFTASGLPCGLQIVAGHLRDRESLAFAAFMERELGGAAIPPGYET
ncbi:MAG: amidase [Actinomycetota bacterium]